MQRGKRAVRWVTALLGASACEPAPPQPEPAVAAITARDPSPEPVPTPAPAVPRPWPVPGIDDAAPLHVIVTDPRVLEHWDGAATRPLALPAILARLHRARGWPEPSGQGPDVLAAFGASWGAIADTLEADIGRVVADLAIDWETDIDRTYDVGAAKTELGADAAHRGNGNVARVFATKWLRSPDARVPLVAMVYRPDRADFTPGTCGELRLIYRLAYERAHGEQVVSSRLPLTINVVLTIPDDGDRCRQVARSFRAPALGDDASARVVADTLLAGPLDATRSVLAQIEVNAQIVRFPSDLERVDGRHFAGQALYWLRIFAPAPAATVLAPIGLENTPDVQAIRADPAKKARLLDQLRADVDGIDRGVFQLSDDLLARVALSWSTHGSARLANRPFAAILDRADAERVLAHASPRAFVTGADGLLERLDGATCMGCHQSASTAGFHLLGVDRPFGSDPPAQAIATDGNRLQSPISPHLVAEIARRTAYAERVAAGEEPARVRPHPSAPIADWAGGSPRYAAARTGMPCTLSGTVASAATWSCAAPAECRALAVRDGVAPLLGQCVASAIEVKAGAACRAVTIATPEVPSANGIAFNVRAFTDRVSVERPLYTMGQGTLTTSAYNCRPPSIGVPLGRVTRRCRSSEHGLDGFDPEVPMPAEVCAIVGGKGFEQMARGAFDPIAFAKGVGRGLLDTCTAQQPCREDYICQELPDFLADAQHRVAADRIAAVHARGIGFCTPTYFVYQLRLDGHPNP